MAIKNVGDASDREQWLETRKQYLTASSIFTWREVDHPRWWGDKRAGVIAEKLEGVEKEFPAAARVAMNHGSFDEQNIANKLGDALGCPVETTNVMMVNDRWPHIAATLDGFLHAPNAPLGPEYCQEPGLIAELSDTLRELDTTCVLEIKKSVSTGWQKAVPVYYLSQIQTQMAVTEMDYAVIVAETFKRDGRRNFWDLRPYLVPRDPDWANVLDQCNQEFLDLVINGGIR